MASPNTRRNVDDIEILELYNTPLLALTKLYEQYPHAFKHTTWFDPCAGLGIMSDFIESITGPKQCFNSDIKCYGDHIQIVKDFQYMNDVDAPLVDCIIMNPPFKLTTEFVTKALSICPKLLMFNRLTTLETKERGRLFTQHWKLKTIYVFSFRVTCTRGLKEESTANSVPYAWYEYDEHYTGKPTVEWIL